MMKVIILLKTIAFMNTMIGQQMALSIKMLNDRSNLAKITNLIFKMIFFGQNELGVRIGDLEIPKKCWAVKHQHVGVVEMRMLRWMCGHTRNDKIRNEDIRGKVGVAEIEGKRRETRLLWFGHVQRRPTDAPVRRCDYGTEVQGRRGRGRLRKTLEETLRKDLEYLDLTEDMTQNRAQWRSRIHIADPT
ncbi:unnamed protein product [Malus baccata var. baccata]